MARKLTPDQMVAPKAIAPFEAALAFQLWAERWASEPPVETSFSDHDWLEKAMAKCDGLGPPWHMKAERPADFGERCAVALFTLIKEI